MINNFYIEKKGIQRSNLNCEYNGIIGHHKNVMQSLCNGYVMMVMWDVYVVVAYGVVLVLYGLVRYAVMCYDGVSYERYTGAFDGVSYKRYTGVYDSSSKQGYRWFIGRI